MDSNGDGIGDLDGIRERLSHVAGLGVDAVWISPFYPSPMADFGYDVADYTDVDPVFGDLVAFDRMLETAHGLDLRVIIDWVPNHTSSAHPWFIESASSRDSAKRDWYTWRDPAPDGGPPNNWGSVFGGSAWEWDEGSGQYYLHSFLAEQPDLNWRNSHVAAAMHDTLRFWLDRGVDGFRIDVAHHVMKDPALRDNPVNDQPLHDLAKPHGDYDRLIPVHSKGHPDVHGVFAQLRTLVDSYEGDRVLIGEIHEYDWPTWAAYYGTHNDELHMPFNFSMLYARWDASVFSGLVGDLEASLPAGAWPNYVLGNHDEPRLVQRFGAIAARVAAMMLLTLRGTPTVYYGDELGMMQAHIRDEDQQDPWGRRLPGAGRDGCRTPMQWSADANAGFSTVEPWLPVVDPDGCHNVEAQTGDPGSMLELYRRLLVIRRAEQSLRAGSFTPIEAPDGIFAYCREAPDAAAISVALNFTSEPATVNLGRGTVLLRTGTGGSEAVDGGLTLAGAEGVMVRH